MPLNSNRVDQNRARLAREVKIAQRGLDDANTVQAW